MSEYACSGKKIIVGQWQQAEPSACRVSALYMLTKVQSLAPNMVP